MRLDVRGFGPSIGGAASRVAFLHEAPDPAAGAPAAVREALREAVPRLGLSAAGTRRSRGADGRGGLGARGSRVRAGARSAAAPGAPARRPRSAPPAAAADSCWPSAPGYRSAGDARAAAAASPWRDYAFERYKSRRSDAEGSRREARAIVLPPPAPARRRLSTAAASEAQIVARPSSLGARPRQHAGQRPRPGRAGARGARPGRAATGCASRCSRQEARSSARRWPGFSPSTPAAPGLRSS